MKKLPSGWPYKMSKQSNRKTLINSCDNIFRKIIRLRDKVCQKTYKQENLQVVHFFTRGNLRVRWDLDNACLLNAAQHIWWAHSHPDQFREFWIKRLGQERFDKLEARANYVRPVKTFELVMIRQELKKTLQEITACVR